MLEIKKRPEQARFKDLSAYIEWCRELTAERMKALWSSMTFNGPNSDILHNVASEMLSFHRYTFSDGDTAKEVISRYLEHLEKLTGYSRRFGQPLEVLFRNEWFAVIYCGNPEKYIGIWDPEHNLTFISPPDRSDLTMQELRALVSGADGQTGFTSLVPSQGDALSVTGVNDQMALLASESEKLKAEMDDIENAASGELAELRMQIERMQQEMQAKKNALLAELLEKKEMFAQKQKELEQQLFILSSQIYCIECYLGEAVNFHHLKQGANAPDDEPIVLHQKLRFLDEELGRLASIYELDWDEKELFEDFLSRSPEALDVFAPNPRCIVLVRLSKTGITHGHSDRHPYSNMLVDYQYYHGKTCGIIIRNGENLYFGWTDEERIQISDDLILNLQTVDVQPAKAPEKESSWDRERRLKEEERTRETLMNEYLSRLFVFNILQGVVDNKANLLPLPKGVKLSKQSEYVKFALADKWLGDSRFGSFNDIVQRCNSRLTKGDYILVTQRLFPEYESGNYSCYYRPGTYQNPRGRGEANRMRDCSVDDCTIYPINLIEFDEPVRMVKYTVNHKDFLDGTVRTYHYCTQKSRIKQLSNECVLGEEYDQIDRHVYISVEKDWSSNNGRSNFELYDEEYINLTYMNSVWLNWVVNIRTLGGWSIKGKAVTYAYAIRYIKTALDFVRKREEQEKRLLDEIDPTYTANNPEWPLSLSEWKLEKGVREITKYQAKRFMKYISGN